MSHKKQTAVESLYDEDEDTEETLEEDEEAPAESGEDDERTVEDQEEEEEVEEFTQLPPTKAKSTNPRSKTNPPTKSGIKPAVVVVPKAAVATKASSSSRKASTGVAKASPPAKSPSPSKSAATAAPAKKRPAPTKTAQPPAKRRGAAGFPGPSPLNPPTKIETVSPPKANPQSLAPAVKGKTPAVIYDVHASVDKYIKWIAATFSKEDLQTRFPKGCYIGNFDLPNVLVGKFDVSALQSCMKAGIRGEKNQNRVFLRQWQAWSLYNYLVSIGIDHVVGFASENAKRSSSSPSEQDKNVKITEPLAGGEKRDDEASEIGERVARVVYVGDTFMYPGEKPKPADENDPRAIQKKKAEFAIKPHLVPYAEDLRHEIHEAILKKEKEHALQCYEALRK